MSRGTWKSSSSPRIAGVLWQHCGTCDAGRDALGTAPVTILPTPAVRTLHHHTYGPGPTSCLEGGPVPPRAPRRGMPITRGRSPGPPSRVPGPPRASRTS